MSLRHPNHLSPSELGTKEYWDSTYTRDVENHASDPAQIGTVWFDDASAEERIIAYLGSDEGSRLDLQATTFLDLGTGNGSMLFALRDEGWEGRMVGVDYSEGSVRLAARIAADTRPDDGSLAFEVWDLIKDSPGRWMESEGFDVVLDKGTFDAISLAGETDAQGRRPCEGYRDRVQALVKAGGLLLVTSCNWTGEELERWLAGGELAVEGSVEYPTFSFGGVEGQSISSVCFRRKTRD